MTEVATLSENIVAYEQVRNELEADKWGRYVVFYDGNMQGDFPDFSEAMQFACQRWGRGPYLVRQVGRPPFVLPASIQYRRLHADS